nr:PrsW family intramembrane metalloprotease [Bacteroidota bacterium]
MNIIVSILPLFLFLILLIVLDSFKLVKGKILGMCFTWGILSAIASYFINNYFIQVFNIPQSGVTWFEAPMVEESLKAVILVVLIRFNKIGFMIDGAIYGFATGAGFAFLENVFYLSQIEDHSLLVWIVRGFGTAIMHGGATSILCIIAINGINRKTRAPGSFALGLLVAIALHALYNQFIFSPQISTIIIVSTLPMIMFFVFRSNERYLRNWLEIELDTEIKLMVMIKKG